jgi:hypothetical protein
MTIVCGPAKKGVQQDGDQGRFALMNGLPGSRLVVERRANDSAKQPQDDGSTWIEADQIQLHSGYMSHINTKGLQANHL